MLVLVQSFSVHKVLFLYIVSVFTLTVTLKKCFVFLSLQIRKQTWVKQLNHNHISKSSVNVLGLGSTIIQTTLVPFQETRCNLLTYSWSSMAAKVPAIHMYSRPQNGGRGEEKEWTYSFLRGLSRIWAILLLVSHSLGLTDMATLSCQEEPWKGFKVEMFQLSLGDWASF